MDQNQTDNLQQAIDRVNNSNAEGKTANDQFGIPPMPPTEGEGVPDAPFVEKPEEKAPAPAGPSAEQILTDSLTSAPEKTETPEVSAPGAASEEVVSGDLASIRENVIKDLLPLMDKVDSTPEEKFAIYKDAMKTMHDAKTIEGAYRTATQITDETKKADALIGLMKTIDNA